MTTCANFIDDFFNQENKNIESYYIEKKLLSDKAFMTKFFFSGQRDLSGEELCLYILANINRLDDGDSYIGGFITLLCYRVFESEARLDWITSVLKFKENYDERCSTDTPDDARWFFSSSNTISTVLLVLGYKKEAKRILEYSLTKFSNSSHSPLLYMNKSFILYQLALIYAEDKEYHNAINLFEKCFLNSKSGIDEIFHPRNNFFLRMYADCDTLLKLAKFSSIAMNKLICKVDARSGTRFTPFAGSETSKVNAQFPLKRFNQTFIPTDNWFLQCEYEINK